MQIDLSVMLKRLPESENYRLDLLLIQNNAPSNSEHYVCQTLAEVFQKTAAFEAKHLHPFENAIEYEQTDWRELARQNRESAQKAKKP